MKLSFVIPAFNEAKWIANCLQHIDAAVDTCSHNGHHDFAFERLVVDNNSTDGTAEIAAEAGAMVVFEAINQISRARNAGALAATGDWLIFIDADSELPAELLNDVLKLIDDGRHIGCGSLMQMEGAPRGLRWSLNMWSWISRTLNWAAGSFVVCRADVFQELGGFSEQLYVAEEIELSRRIKRYARTHDSKFVVLREHPLQTSGRKAELYSDKELISQMFRLLFRPRKTMQDKQALNVWYDGRR
jgi:glycosyltransferase involved in cell wall biosynthesis